MHLWLGRKICPRVPGEDNVFRMQARQMRLAHRGHAEKEEGGTEEGPARMGIESAPCPHVLEPCRKKHCGHDQESLQ